MRAGRFFAFPPLRHMRVRDTRYIQVRPPMTHPMQISHLPYYVLSSDGLNCATLNASRSVIPSDRPNAVTDRSPV